jgi:hypothetical protein
MYLFKKADFRNLHTHTNSDVFKKADFRNLSLGKHTFLNVHSPTLSLLANFANFRLEVDLRSWMASVPEVKSPTGRKPSLPKA